MSTTIITNAYSNGQAEPTGPYITPAGALDPTGNIRPLQLDTADNLYITAGGTFPLSVAKGQISGTGGQQALGEREAIAAVTKGEDIWMGVTSSVPIPPVAGEQMTIVSTSDSDADGDIGVQEVRINYLDSSGLEQNELLVPTGTTPKNTAATDIRFVNRIYATSVGGNGVAVGTITIYKLGAPATVYNLIFAGGNMSLTVNYMVPSNKTLYVTSWLSSVSGKDKRVALRLRSTSQDGILYDGANPVFLFIDTMNLANAATTNQFNPYVEIPSTAIIKVSGWVDAPNVGAFVSASFQGYLIDN